ncbi:MAG: Signal recognition particle receptor FtsY [Fimbriimonadales bacterium]|nr:Signal recognition particle receptor FtsY [Fimbriimonadales bacterium]
MRLGIFRGLRDRIDRLFGRGVVDDALFEELEEALLSADVGVTTTHDILDALREHVKKNRVQSAGDIRSELAAQISSRLQDEAGELAISPNPPTVYLFIGVNGAGKTTTIAKLGHSLIQGGKKVLFAAGDTFRAAAIEQLETWAKRVGADFVRGAPGGDSAAVIFDAITAAKARGADYVLADTAGRQHTKASLMSELSKVIKVAEKAAGRPPDEVLLVLDGNTGQNAIRQAEEFAKAAGVTGAVITKLDGTPKGGAVIGVKEKLGIPVKLVGLGEHPGDLRAFDPEEFAHELIG